MEQASVDLLRECVQQEAEAWRRFVPSGHVGAWLKAEFVHRKGIACIAQPLPAGVRRMPAQQCFRNAFLLIDRHPDLGLTYCEGYVMLPEIALPIHHAWCIDAENRVVDPTLRTPEQNAYFGVPVDRVEHVALALKRNGIVCVLVNEREMVEADWILSKCPELEPLLGFS